MVEEQRYEETIDAVFCAEVGAIVDVGERHKM